MAVCLHTVLMLQHNSEDQWVYSGQLLLSSETKVFAVEFNKVERRQSLWLSLLTEASEKYHQILFWKYWIVTSDGCWWSDDNNMCSTGATCQLCSLVSATEALCLLVSRPELGSCLDTLCVWWPSSALFSTAGSHSTHGKLPPKLLSHTTDHNWPALVSPCLTFHQHKETLWWNYHFPRSLLSSIPRCEAHYCLQSKMWLVCWWCVALLFCCSII